MNNITNWVDKECKSVEWWTPEYILDCVRTYFDGPIPLDPATTPDNRTKATTFYSASDDGLDQAWTKPVFVNPPYGKVFPLWCNKIGYEASKSQVIIALLPCGARFSTKYWQEHIFNQHLKGWCFLSKRVSFISETGPINRNPYDSQIMGFNVDIKIFQAAFSTLGKVFSVQQ